MHEGLKSTSRRPTHIYVMDFTGTQSASKIHISRTYSTSTTGMTHIAQKLKNETKFLRSRQKMLQQRYTPGRTLSKRRHQVSEKWDKIKCLLFSQGKLMSAAVFSQQFCILDIACYIIKIMLNKRNIDNNFTVASSSRRLLFLLQSSFFHFPETFF